MLFVDMVILETLEGWHAVSVTALNVFVCGETQ